jgi:hypothetical protein
MAAQTKIKGKYDSKSKLFIADEKEYWIDFFENGVAKISKDGYFGLIDTTGKIIVDVKYDKIKEIDSKLIRVVLNGKLMFIEIGNKNIFNPDYYIYPFHEGIAKFTEDGKTYGFINESGKVISYTANNFKDFVGGIAEARYGDITTLMDKTGHTESFETFITWSSSNMLNKKPARRQGIVIIPIKEDMQEKYYYVNEKFEKLSNLHFNCVSNFANGYASVNYNGTWYIIDTNGKLLETEYKSIVAAENGTFIATNKNNQVGVIDYKGNVIIPFNFGQVKYLFDDLYAVNKSEFSPNPFFRGGFYVINIKNDEILPPLYNYFPSAYYSIDVCHLGIGVGIAFKVEKMISDMTVEEQMYRSKLPTYTYIGEYYYFDKNGLISRKGYPNNETVADAIYKNYYVKNNIKFHYYDSKQTTIYTQQHKPLLNLEENQFEIIDFDEYEGYFPLGSKRIIVSNKDENGNIKYGMVDIKKNTIISMEYQELRQCVFNRLLAKKDNKWGMVDYNKKEITPFNYDDMVATETGAIVVVNGKYGFIDLTGKELIPFIYDDLTENTNNGFFYARINNEQIHINRKGIQIIINE